MSSVAERLVQQMVKMHQRECELEAERAALRKKEEIKASLVERGQLLKGQAEKVDKVRSALEQLNRDAEETFAKARREDEEKRAELSQKLQGTIEAVNAYSNDVLQLEAKANNENASLKEQLAIYDKYRSSGQGKYEEIMKSRDAEYEKIAANRDAAVARLPLLHSMLTEESAALELARTEQAKVQEEVKSWTRRISEIHERLLKARGRYESAREEKEKLLRRMQSLETERQKMIKRAETSKVERDKERAKVEAMEEKVSTIRKQTEKLLAVVKMLEEDDECSAPSDPTPGDAAQETS